MLVHDNDFIVHVRPSLADGAVLLQTMRRDLLRQCKMTRVKQSATRIGQRQAKESDFDFAFSLYLDGSQALLLDLGNWDEARIEERFRNSFNARAGKIITLAGRKIGWMQVSETAQGYHLDQIHIIRRYRGHGTGRRLIAALLDLAEKKGRTLSLNVIRGNRAKSLYDRMGFRVAAEDEEKFLMQRHPR